ncbi:MAG: TetR/AcrR family transcriptional regulator [Propionibacteriaceae bacterium]
MKRAAPLPPDERRAAILAATTPLLEEYGREVTTRQIAQAAGVAEGTLFRVFDSKEAIVDAVVCDLIDPEKPAHAIEAIDPELDLETRLVRTVTILQDRMQGLMRLFHALRIAPGPGKAEVHSREALDQRLGEAIESVIGSDRDRLTHGPEAVAALLRAVAFSSAHPMFARQFPADPQSLVRVLLHGVLHSAKDDA